MNVHVDPVLVAGLLREVEGHLTMLAERLRACRDNPEAREPQEDALRQLELIKEAGAALGLPAMCQVAEYPAGILEQLLSGDMVWGDDTADTLSAAPRRIADALRQAVQRGLLDPAPAQEAAPAPPAEAPSAEVPLMEADDVLKAIAEIQQPGAEWQTLDVPSADEDLWQAFTEEAGEHFVTLDAAFQTLEHGIEEAALKAVRRSVHQLKGASGVLGMRGTSNLNAAMQRALDAIFEERAAFSPGLIPLLKATVGIVREAVENKGSGPGLKDHAEAMLAVFRELEASRSAATPPPAVTAGPSAHGATENLFDIPDADTELWEAFSQEAEEHLVAISELLRHIESGTPQPDTIQSMRRSVHTLKGACGVVGLRLTSSVAHRMEDLLDALYDRRRAFTPEIAPLLFTTFDLLTDGIGARGLTEEARPRVAEIYVRYEEALSTALPQTEPSIPEEPEAEAEAPAPAQPAEAPKASPVIATGSSAGEAHGKSSQYVRAPLEKVDELVRLVSELVIHRSRFEQHLSAYVHEIGELQLSIERLTRISRRLQSDYEAAALQEANRVAFAAVGSRGGTSVTHDFDALEFDRYTEFHLLSRELAETTGDVTNAGSRLNDLVADFDSYLNRLGTLTADVEDRLMRLRMLPLKTISTRLHRTVRVTAERRNKNVNFVIDGESVELDKTVLEEMAGPLDHILRNGVDHGIETAAERRAAGKPERGTITLKAGYEGTQIVLHIKDDGRGLDRERLREKAVRMGMANEQESANWSDAELYNLIFLPGFSTAKEISEVSGRGVGLDVVKEAVSKMKGTLSVTSEKGRGTTFTIRLPMTMALTRVVLVKAGSETFAIPLTSIGQILRVEPEQLERVGRKPVLRLAGKIVPTMHLTEFVGQPLPSDVGLTRLKAVILNIGDQRLALMVDHVVEAREVVVKSLGSLLGRVHGVTGATLMGDGSVVLILNPNDMLHQQLTMAPQMRLRSMSQQTQPDRDSLEVLIVDDSPSVRRVLTNLIRSTGWTPHAAKDGLDALEMIHASTVRPDVVILDVEMPRMDGYEFTAALRNMFQHRHTPVVMLTSRAGEKHRKRAFEVGATDYMVKPYQDDELVSTLRRVVEKARRQEVIQ